MENTKFQYWKQSVYDTENFTKYADFLYQEHKNLGKKDYLYHGKLPGIEDGFYRDQSFDFQETHIFRNIPLMRSSTQELPRLGKVDQAYESNDFTTAPVEDDHPMCCHIKDFFNLETVFISINLQKPNKVIGLHVDTNKSLIIKHPGDFLISKLKKYIVFLTPWSEGQVFMIGTSAYTNWNIGDIVSFDWYMPHATANASSQDRYLFFISGVEK
jgi:hypothetical protein